MVAKIQFNRKWIFQGGGTNSLAVSKAMDLCKKEFEGRVKVETYSMNECVLEISTEESPDELCSRLKRLIAERILGGVEDDSVFTLSIEGAKTSETQAAGASGASGKGDPAAAVIGAVPHTETHAADTPEGKTSDAAAAPASPEKRSSLEKINALTGAANFKAVCNEIHKRAELIRRNNTVSAFLSDSFLFPVSTGGGYSYALSLLNQLLTEEKLLAEGSRVEEVNLPSPNDQEVQAKLANCFEAVSHALDSPRIISFDISNWVAHTGKPEFKGFLHNITRKSGKSLVVFRTPYIGQDLLKQTCADLNDLISTRVVEFKPFSEQELRELAANMLSEYGFTMGEDAWQVFDDKMTEEKRDGFFYGIYTVRKTVNEIIHCAEMYSADNNAELHTITRESIAALLPAVEESGVSAMEMLDSLVGMDGIKAQIMEVITQIMMSMSQSGPARPCMHMRFVGNPGTGKTTVARIIGRILNEKGVLRIGKFYEHKGRDLCGRYVGETAPKTSRICQEAYGSVLFLDEAYSLFRGGFESNDYGREALDTLVAEMENHSDDLLVIFAGYPGDMDTLMEGNAGLKSRMPYLITFPDYTREQLFDIFMGMTEKNFAYTDDLKDCAKEYFLSLPDRVINEKKFGNARFVRNIYERVWGKAGVRCLGENPDQLTLTGEDFKAAIDALQADYSGKGEKEKMKIGF